MTALEVAREMVRRGFSVVPVKHADKVPTDPRTGLPLKDWQTLRIAAADLPKYFNGKPQNVGFLCGEPSGNLNDIDLDCLEAGILAPHFLPVTAAIFGRASNPKSHWLYTCTLASEKFTDELGKVLLEIRSTGLQTVAPGSTHTSGELIQWATGYDDKPAVVKVDELARGVSRLAAATLLARHYPPQGGRHDFALHLAGGLLRAGWSEADAGAFGVAVGIAGRSTNPEDHRVAAKDTAAKISRGENVSGWPSVAQVIGDAAVAKVRGWLGCNAAANDADQVWETPIPFDDAGKLPPFPLHVLPPVLREWVEAEAEATQTPVELAACIALAVVSAAVQKKFEVEVRTGWREPLSIFVLAAMGPAERKSSVFREATAPIREWERSQAERSKATIAAATTKRQIKEKRHVELVKKAASRGDGLLAHEAEELAVELAEERVPVVPRVACDDVTPERLNSLIWEHGGRMAVLSAEGGLFENVAGRYSDGVANLDGLLKGHAGDELRVDRMNRPTQHVRRPALTLGLCVQPSVLQGLAQKPTFRGRGLLARCLFVLPQSRVGFRNVAPASVPPEVTARYNALILRLLALPENRDESGEITATVLKLSADSMAAVSELAQVLEPKLAPGGELSSIQDWAGKSIGAVVRIAGLLHLAANSVDCVDSVGSVHCVGSVREKSEILSFFTDHSLGAFRVIGTDPSTNAARVVWDWLAKNKLKTFTKRDTHVALRSTFKEASELDKPLEVLTEHGFIRLGKQAERVGAGRKASPAYETNPAAHNSQNTQNRPGSVRDAEYEAEERAAIQGAPANDAA